jgi:hypothetical protein
MTLMHRGWLVALIAGGLALPALTPADAATDKPAAAAGPTSIGTFKDWTAWTGTDSTGLICYISAEPNSSKPDGVNRDPIHFLVVNRKGLGTKNEVQTLIGYPIKKDSKPASNIDGKTYPMIAEGSGAWLASTADESGFVAAQKKGSTLTVTGTSQRGTLTTDTNTLAGVRAPREAIDKACS